MYVASIKALNEKVEELEEEDKNPNFKHDTLLKEVNAIKAAIK